MQDTNQLLKKQKRRLIVLKVTFYIAYKTKYCGERTIENPIHTI